MPTRTPIAVVGMDCLLPGADSAEQWIARSLSGEQSLSEVPAGRWPVSPQQALARGEQADGCRTLVGGFVEDPGSTRDWVLRVTERALAGVTANRSRTSLLLANLSLPSSGAVRVAGIAWRDWLQARGAEIDWLEPVDPQERWHSGAPAMDAAEALGLGGTALALDAAAVTAAIAAAAPPRADPEATSRGPARLRDLAAACLAFGLAQASMAGAGALGGAGLATVAASSPSHADSVAGLLPSGRPPLAPLAPLSRASRSLAVRSSRS